MYCRWFVKCENRAIGLAAHPVFTAVPICYRCAMRLGIEVPLPTCCVCGANVPPQYLGDLDYQDGLYCSHECWAIETYIGLDPNDPTVQKFIHDVALQTRY